MWYTAFCVRGGSRCCCRCRCCERGGGPPIPALSSRGGPLTYAISRCLPEPSLSLSSSSPSSVTSTSTTTGGFSDGSPRCGSPKRPAPPSNLGSFSIISRAIISSNSLRAIISSNSRSAIISSNSRSAIISSYSRAAIISSNSRAAMNSSYSRSRRPASRPGMGGPSRRLRRSRPPPLSRLSSWWPLGGASRGGMGPLP